MLELLQNLSRSNCQVSVPKNVFSLGEIQIARKRFKVAMLRRLVKERCLNTCVRLEKYSPLNYRHLTTIAQYSPAAW